MKKSLLIFWLFSLFITTNLKAQDCLQETRMDDPEANKAVAKSAKFFCQDFKVQVGENWKGEISTKGQYLRHTFLDDWYYFKEDNANFRRGYIIVAIKTDKGCALTVLEVQQASLGVGKFGNAEVYKPTTPLGDGGFGQQYMKQTVDCDCVLKTTDWSK
jgi:hypothetical protein